MSDQDLAPITLAQLPLRPELVGEEPYGAPQLDVPVLTACTELPLAFETSGLARDREVSSLTALARATVAAAQDWVDTAE